MVSALVAMCSMQATVPQGAFGMLELCRNLEAASNERHVVPGRLADAVVYFQIANPTPERVRASVADVLRAEWKNVGGEWQLSLLKELPRNSFPWFKTAWDENAKSEPFNLFDAETAYSAGGAKFIRKGKGQPGIRRMIGNLYVSRWDAQLMMSVKSPAFNQWLEPHANKPFVLPKSMAPVPRMGGTSAPVFDAKWQDYMKRDPVAVQVQPLFNALSEQLKTDFVAAVPDYASFGVMLGGAPTVGAALNGLATISELDYVDNRVVIRYLYADAKELPLLDRSALVSVIAKYPTFIDTLALVQVDRSQPDAVSNSLVDIIGLVATDNLVANDMHYPYSVRLYSNLSDGDFAMLWDGNAKVGNLSPRAQTALWNLYENRIAYAGLLTKAQFADLAIKGTREKKQELVFKFSNRPKEFVDYLNAASHRIWSGYVDSLGKWAPVETETISIVTDANQAEPIKFQVATFPSGTELRPFARLPEETRRQVMALEAQLKNQREGGIIPPSR